MPLSIIIVSLHSASFLFELLFFHHVIVDCYSLSSFNNLANQTLCYRYSTFPEILFGFILSISFLPSQLCSLLQYLIPLDCRYLLHTSLFCNFQFSTKFLGHGKHRPWGHLCKNFFQILGNVKGAGRLQHKIPSHKYYKNTN